ncbi:hypothetical protein [Bradyrhizobium sp. USDA 3364]
MSWDVIWFTRSSDGYDLINFDLFDRDGWPIFQMRDNDWIVFPRYSDLEAPPSGRRLQIRSRDNEVALDLEFRAAGESGATCEISGKLVWPRQFSFDARGIHLPGGNTISGSTAYAVPVAVHLFGNPLPMPPMPLIP